MHDIKKTQRDSNFELLRILSMFAIVLGHFCDQTGLYSLYNGMSLYLFLFIGSASRIAVSVFLIMGIWFMVDKNFCASRVLKLYGQLSFYTISILCLLKLFHVKVSLFNTIRAIFPFYGWGLWFVTAYLCLILLSPFLNKILDFDRKILKKFLFVLFFLIPVMATIWIKMDTKLCVTLYFIYAYLNVGYYKKYLHNTFKLGWKIPLVTSLLTYLVLVTIRYWGINSDENLLFKFVINYLDDYKSIPNLIISLPIFYFFLNLNIGCNKIINFIAKPTLAVYIVHQAPGLIPLIWFDIMKCDMWLTSKYAFLYIFLVPVVLFGVCILFEYIRKNLIETNVIKTKLYKFLENKINSSYEDIQSIYGGG